MIEKTNIENLKNKKIAIIGAGKSGIAAAHLINYLDALPFISESSKSIPESCRQFDHEIGGHTELILDSEIIIISPGVPDTLEIIELAKAKHIPIVSEIEFASWFTSVPILAVTGSNGKTTTTLLLDAMCKSAELTSVAAGNLGIPFSEVVLNELKSGISPDVYVLEVSSFQLEHINHFSPFIGCILNVRPDHMDRYENFQDYLNAKLNLFKALKEPGWFVYNADDPYLSEYASDQNPYHIPFSLNIHNRALFLLNESKAYYTKNDQKDVLYFYKDNQLPGDHNIQNILAAATIAFKFGISIGDIKRAIESFSPVPHRIEFCGFINDAKCYNDSKATNLDAVTTALDCFDQKVILLLGGKPKGDVDFSLLHPYFEVTIKSIISYGEASQLICDQLQGFGQLYKNDDFDQACFRGFEIAEKGDIILLSPGYASFDQFSNFEERGNRFKKLVQNFELSAID